jgi:hypothetical protein
MCSGVHTAIYLYAFYVDRFMSVLRRGLFEHAIYSSDVSRYSDGLHGGRPGFDTRQM